MSRLLHVAYGIAVVLLLILLLVAGAGKRKALSALETEIRQRQAEWGQINASLRQAQIIVARQEREIAVLRSQLLAAQNKTPDAHLEQVVLQLRTNQSLLENALQEKVRQKERECIILLNEKVGQANSQLELLYAAAVDACVQANPVADGKVLRQAMENSVQVGQYVLVAVNQSN